MAFGKRNPQKGQKTKGKGYNFFNLIGNLIEAAEK